MQVGVPKEIKPQEYRVALVPDAVRDADVVMALRIQLERQNDSLIPSLREYSKFYGVNRKLLELAKEDAIVMHPGPVNRGVELSPDVADGHRARCVRVHEITLKGAL